jgi:glycosyltransferase involved in cell wall biosynthesis
MRDGRPPMFSIVTVCLNAERHIGEAIESVLGQSFGEFEYIIVDGGSTDRTVEIVREAEDRAAGRLRWTSEPDRGLFHAMNKGLALAEGAYVEFLGADDHLASGALASVARLLGEAEPVAVVCGGTRVLSSTGCWNERARSVIRRGMPQRAPSRHQSIFVEREALVAIGGFNERFRIASDYDLYLRLIESGASERLVDDVLSEFRLGGVSSSNAWATAREYRDVRVAHGASPLVEYVVMAKSAAAATVFAAWRSLTHVQDGSRT